VPANAKFKPGQALVIFVNVPAGSAGKLSGKPKALIKAAPKPSSKKPFEKQQKK
jgi:hypothetical protein